MRPARPLEDLYWQELGEALRALVALAVVPLAACAAALTLTGAASLKGDGGSTPSRPSACQACHFEQAASSHAPH